MIVDTCTDGEYAVKIFKEKNEYFSLFNINLIIMDYNMLIMNGDEACIKVFFLYID